MFDSLRASGAYADLLLTACGSLIDSGLDLRVWHIPGHWNTIADALSRGLIQTALQYVPSLRISTFTPPQITLGAAIV